MRGVGAYRGRANTGDVGPMVDSVGFLNSILVLSPAES
jgi:hypothetical protein